MSTYQNRTSHGFGFLFEMGCGKTLTAIAVMGAMYQQGKIRRVLIVAPSSVCAVWPRELAEFAAFPHRAALLLGDKKKRLSELSRLVAAEEIDTPALNVAVINYESTFREGILEALQDFAPDMIVCDESQRIKTHNAAQSKAMHKLGDMAAYKLILSGTPIQNAAIDLYSQYRFLDTGVFGSNFYAFQNRYAIMGGYQRHQIVGYRDMDELTKKAHSVAYRVTKEECLDLPEQTFENRYVEFEPETRKLYEQIKRESYAELDGGDTVTATTVLTRLLRLQQLTGGYLQTDEGAKPERVSEAKIKAMADILEDYVIGSGKKLVIFARFIPEIMAIEKLLQEKKIRYGMIYGDVKLEDRGEIVKDFQTNPETMVFVAQLQTAGLGITLHAASAAVFYSVDYNYANYSQALARIHRIGQKNACTYILLMVANSIDDKVMQALSKKEELARKIVDNWREFFE